MNAVKSASRVLDVLEFLAIAPGTHGLVEIARRLGMPKSSTSMLLQTLEMRGYVVADAGRRFSLNPAYREGQSWVGGSQALLTRQARPLMRELVEKTGESSFLGVRTRDWRLQYLEKAVSPNEVRYDADITALRPLHCTSVGMAILAFEDEDRIEAFLATGRFEKLTPHTRTDPNEISVELRQIRARGYAESINAHVVGAGGCAAPIFGPGETVCAAINISAPTERYRRNRARLRMEVLDAAQRLSETMRGVATGSARPPPNLAAKSA